MLTTDRGLRAPESADGRSSLPPATAVENLARDVDRRLVRAMSTAERLALSSTSQGAGTTYDPLRAERWDGCIVIDNDHEVTYRWSEAAQDWWPIDLNPGAVLALYAYS